MAIKVKNEIFAKKERPTIPENLKKVSLLMAKI